jgi:hypothetical protein
MSACGVIEQRGFGESRGSPVADVFSLLLRVRRGPATRLVLSRGRWWLPWRWT